jgi:HAE1 family hydrophobic/amphiphilic exporter-1/multidrug efflux pump
MQEISKLVDDSIPAKKVSLVVTSPGFGSSVNSGFVRLSKEPGERKSQEEIADKLTKWTKQYPNAKTSVTQQPTIRGQQTWWFTDTILFKLKILVS